MICFFFVTVVYYLVFFVNPPWENGFTKNSKGYTKITKNYFQMFVILRST
jgi:hypothetical protein